MSLIVTCYLSCLDSQLGRLRGLAVACCTTDHYHPCSNLRVGISEGCFIFGSRSAHLAYHVHKSGRKTSIIIIIQILSRVQLVCRFYTMLKLCPWPNCQSNWPQTSSTEVQIFAQPHVRWMFHTSFCLINFGSDRSIKPTVYMCKGGNKMAPIRILY